MRSPMDEGSRSIINWHGQRDSSSMNEAEDEILYSWHGEGDCAPTNEKEDEIYSLTAGTERDGECAHGVDCDGSGNALVLPWSRRKMKY